MTKDIFQNYREVGQDVTKAVSYINQGRVVAFPTGTSYGLAADATQGFAIQRVRNLKGRPNDKTFTIMVRPEYYAKYLILTKEEKRLLDGIQRKAVTLLVKPTKYLRHLELDGVVGLRMVDHPVMEQFVDMLNVPVTATSANRSGKKSCYSIACIKSNFPGKLTDDLLEEDDPRGASGTTYDLSLAYILDGGELKVKQATTVVKLMGDQVEIVRQGKITAEYLRTKL